jgi:hypothetical protein
LARAYAVIYAQWGQHHDALRWLQTAWPLRHPGLADIKVNPMLDPIRDMAGFAISSRRRWGRAASGPIESVDTGKGHEGSSSFSKEGTKKLLLC